MNSLRCLRLCLASAVCSGIFLSSLPLSAADNVPKIEPGSVTSVRRFVIANGVLPDKKPATVRNVVDSLSSNYSEANITVVGVENVLIENLTIQLAKTFRPAGVPPGTNLASADLIHQSMPLEGVLEAVAEASGRKIRVRPYGPNAFMLSPVDAAPAGKSTEVFNLSILKRGRINASIQDKILEADRELAVLRASYGEKHPMTLEATARIDALRAQLASVAPGAPDSSKLIEDIRDAVSSFLALKSGEAPPEFKFHAGTNLLIVVGSEQGIDAAKKVIAALEKTP